MCAALQLPAGSLLLAAPRKWRWRANTVGGLSPAQWSAAGRVLPGRALHPRWCSPTESPTRALCSPSAVPPHPAQVALWLRSSPQPGPRAGPAHGTLTGRHHTWLGHPSPCPHAAMPSPSRSFHPPGLGATALLYLWAPAAGDLGGHGSAGCRVTAGTGLAPRCRHSLCPEMTNFSASPLPAQHKTDTCEDDHYFPTEPHRRIKGARRGLPTRGHQSESQSLLGRGHLRAGRALQSSLGPPRPNPTAVPQHRAIPLRFDPTPVPLWAGPAPIPRAPFVLGFPHPGSARAAPRAGRCHPAPPRMLPPPPTEPGPTRGVPAGWMSTGRPK